MSYENVRRDSVLQLFKYKKLWEELQLNRLIFFHFILSIVCYDTVCYRTEITASHNMVACVFVAAEKCLWSRSLTTAVSSDCTVDRENTHVSRWSPKPPFIFFQNKEGSLKEQSSVGIATRLWLIDLGYCVWFPAESRDMSLLHNVEICSGPRVGTVNCFPRCKAVGDAKLNTHLYLYGGIPPLLHTSLWCDA
jgi:hypothetical protein